MERMKLFITLAALLIAADQSFAARQVLNENASPSSKGGLNSNFSKANVNFAELYSLAIAAPWLAQGTAPNITNVFWVDTSGADPVIKYHNGSAWVAASSGAGGTYTLPTASADTLGGIKVGARLTITDGVLSADVQSGTGAVDSVNTKTGTVVINPDDLVDTSTTNKFVSAAEKTKLANLSGINTGDQTLPTDATLTTTDITTNNATTSKHGWLLKATAPASGLRNVVAIDNGETAYSNKALFDATSPSTQAFGDSAAVGSSMTVARRDHKHQMPAAPTTISGNAGTSTALAANPTDCSAGQYATTIAANGNLTCDQVNYSQIGSTPTLGTAAALDHGTAIGNLVRLTDDGGGNPALPFSLYLTNALLGSSTSLPGTCTVGQTYYDLDADTDGELYVCRATNTWKAVDDDGAVGITASSTDTFTNKTIDTAATGNAIAVPLNGVLDGAITDPADADDMIYKKVQNAMTLTDIHCLAEGGGTITLTLQECTTAGASCANIETAITCDADGAEDDGTLSDASIAAGAWVKVLYSAPTGIVNNVAWTVFGTQTW